MVDIGHTSLVGGGLWHGSGFKFHFNLLRDVVGHFFVLVFIDHQARSVSRCWAPCVSKLPRPPPGG
jgi:hypothetical protein